MSKKDLTISIATKANLSVKETEAFLNLVLDTIQKELKKNQKISIIGFGNFEIKKRAGRMGVNPSTGEKIEIKPSNQISFKAGKSFKDFVN